MSTAALALKKQQAMYYVQLHADATTFQVLDNLDATVIELPGLYDDSRKSDGARKMGTNLHSKGRRVVLIWSGYLSYFTPGVTNITIKGEKHKVRKINDDLSDSSYLSELWLV